MESVPEPRAWQARMQAARDYADFDRAYQLDWIRGMCRLVGVPSPPEDESIRLAREVGGSIPPRVNAAFPGVVQAIQDLHARGYPLYTASGESSAVLAGYLTAMGVRDLFIRLYGPDLIDVLKAGPEYYDRLFTDAGVTPSDAIVVDDSPNALSWAEEVGARTVLVAEAQHALAQTGTSLVRQDATAQSTTLSGTASGPARRESGASGAEPSIRITALQELPHVLDAWMEHIGTPGSGAS
jgi:HAD superfamily hydrolase (TIGR01509 family)